MSTTAEDIHVTSASLARRQEKMEIDLDAAPKPIFYKLRVPLVKQGRTVDAPLSEENMWIKVKSYASGGENALHMHPYQDHTFILLQGAAKFYGPRGEERVLSKYDAIFLPAGSFYCFEAMSEENLILLRIGTKTGERSDNPNYRVDIEGEYMDPKSSANKDVEIIYDGDKVFGEPS